MSANDRWLLPDGIEEILPPQAQLLEALRRRLLDLCATWGYELVMPPLLEYLEALLTGSGTDLELQTFKLTDQLTGRLMGLRADTTPQVARIDAHYLRREVPVRLCYAGPVLHTRPSEFAGSRELLQLGAELYGHAGPESEIEVVRLMLTLLGSAGLRGLYLDLGHVGVFRALAREAGLSAEQEHELFDALQRKARPEAEALLARYGLNPGRRARLAGLLDLNGGSEVLEQAKALLQGGPTAAGAALVDLETIATAVGRAHPDLALYFDLAELSGYRYYTGAVFSVFTAGHGQALAKGGRYDGIGRAFGRERAATGFSADLRFLLNILPPEPAGRGAVYAPVEQDEALGREIERLRAVGERVIVALPGAKATAAELGCDRALVRTGGAWTVKPIG